jgi:uncharacterized protein (TIGR03435 family)
MVKSPRHLPTSPRLATLVTLLGASLFAGLLGAQQPPQQTVPLSFEVAAIKPSAPGQPGSLVKGIPAPGGTFSMVNVPLKQWVEMALSVSDYALKAPAWLGDARFDLDAKIPDGQPVSPKDRNEMLLTLLKERFGFTYHEEHGTVSGYELVAGKKLLLKVSDLSDPRQVGGGSRGPNLIEGHNMLMPELAADLGEVLATPVIDSTHLSGGFEVNLGWRPDDETAALSLAKRMNMNVDDLPSTVYSALEEQAGLRLQRAQVPSTIIVVDAINREPTPN